MEKQNHVSTRVDLLADEEEKELSLIIQKGIAAAKCLEELGYLEELDNSELDNSDLENLGLGSDSDNLSESKSKGNHKLDPKLDPKNKSNQSAKINGVEPQPPQKGNISAAKLKKLKSDMCAGRAASDKFTKANMGFVVYLAQQYKGRGLSEQDLIQEGYLALIRAVKGFDASKGNRFITYANQWVTRAMARAIQKQTRLLKLSEKQIESLAAVNNAYAKLETELQGMPTTAQLAKETGMSLKEVEEMLKLRGTHLSLEYETGDGDGTLGENIEYGAQAEAADSVVKADTNNFFSKEVFRALDKLDELSRDILIMRFGLNGEPPMELQKVAHTLSAKNGKPMSIAKVRHMESQALKVLRHKVSDTEVVRDLL